MLGVFTSLEAHESQVYYFVGLKSANVGEGQAVTILFIFRPAATGGARSRAGMAWVGVVSVGVCTPDPAPPIGDRSCTIHPIPKRIGFGLCRPQGASGTTYGYPHLYGSRPSPRPLTRVSPWQLDFILYLPRWKRGASLGLLGESSFATVLSRGPARIRSFPLSSNQPVGKVIR